MASHINLSSLPLPIFFNCLLAMLLVMQGLGSPTRDQTHTPTVEAQI